MMSSGMISAPYIILGMNRNTILGTVGVSLLLLLMGIVSQQEASSIDPVKYTASASNFRGDEISSTTQMSKLARASNRLGFELLAQLQTQQPETNLVLSPNSIAIALAMLRRGADGDTLAEMDAVLGLTHLDATTIDTSYQKLLNTLKTAEPNVQLAIANSLWVNQKINLKEPFINTAKEFYQAEVSNLDFADSQVENTINQWVAKNTSDRITQIVDDVNPEAALYLINAIYFKGVWTTKFDPSQTSEQPFYLSSGKSKTVPMMNQSGEYRYYENQQLQAIRLPYGKQEEIGMYIVLPQETTSLKELQSQLTPEQWQEWLSQMRSHEGNITLPRFQLESETDLRSPLAALGLNQIFNPQAANFSAMTDTSVAVDGVKHKTLVEVNEEGTEAAGVTSIGIRITSVETENVPFNMRVERPFFVVIRDDITESILFMGNVFEP